VHWLDVADGASLGSVVEGAVQAWRHVS
jgi:hypothetical protein